MYAKFFFERFWEGEQKNQLFVCMPFHDSLDSKFDRINTVACKTGFDKAVRVKEDRDSNVITDKIFNGIANSKMLLFDLSDDPKSPCIHSNQPNANVIYELGIANAIREPQDVLLIREKSSSIIPFDVKGMTINEYSGNLKVKWLIKKLKEIIEKQEWYRSKRIKAVTKSIDEFSLSLMYESGRNPKGYNHFSVKRDDHITKTSVLRLIDLGVLTFDSKCHEKGYEYAYHWTPFGYEVMKHLGIKMLTMDEFKKTPQYLKRVKANKEWEKTVRKIKGQ